jgi:hypothetical protein
MLDIRRYRDTDLDKFVEKDGDDHIGRDPDEEKDNEHEVYQATPVDVAVFNDRKDVPLSKSKCQK